ncbi:MAG: hypothetical protein MAG795_00829 [Candidatus Woesearchaeota archaeon]|nr:hypothetical protein [Candidatus Woesearchaeota archaeon]
MFFIAILFGSYVKGRNTEDSDIDLLFVIPDTEKTEDFENKIDSIFSLINYDWDINIITQQSFSELKRGKNLNVVKEVINNHIILTGGEHYFRLLTKK